MQAEGWIACPRSEANQQMNQLRSIEKIQGHNDPRVAGHPQKFFLRAKTRITLEKTERNRAWQRIDD
jgi:hypothetical protein